jgi:hypothetical protein
MNDHEIIIIPDVDVGPLDVTDRSDFMAFCGFKESLYKTDIRLVNCSTSIYIFADGIEMAIIFRNYSRMNVNSMATVSNHAFFTRMALLVHPRKFTIVFCNL